MIPLYGTVQRQYEYTSSALARAGQPPLPLTVPDPGDPATLTIPNFYSFTVETSDQHHPPPRSDHLSHHRRRASNSLPNPLRRSRQPARATSQSVRPAASFSPERHHRAFSLSFALRPNGRARSSSTSNIPNRDASRSRKAESLSGAQLVEKEEEEYSPVSKLAATAQHVMDGNTPTELATRLASGEDTVRKLAAFKLKDAIGDPSFADVFEAEGGVKILKSLCMTSSANTLAYSLACFANLLDIDKGWEEIDQTFVQRVVALVIKEPLVNILRGAMSILVTIVQRSGSKTLLQELSAPEPDKTRTPDHRYRLFLEMLVSRLSSADHQLCANALQLINSLMRDAITTNDAKWPQFIKQVQDLGVIRAVYSLMQSNALQDLAQPLLEFQTLTKILLRKWRDVVVDMKRPEHQKAMKGIASATTKALEREIQEGVKFGFDSRSVQRADVWKRLGFEDDERLEPEFDEVGFLGMMDLADYVRKTDDGFEKLVLEQGIQPVESRCPIARASIAVTSILYDHFDIDKPDLDDVKEYLALDSRNGVERLFRPMLLQWSKLHTAGVQSFLRIWKATGAKLADFEKVTELIRILMDAVVGGAPRMKEIGAMEEEIASYDCQTLRELQMELVELAYEDSWGEHLKQVREELHHEALLFIKEQRIRCMLAGSWFPKRAETPTGQQANGINGTATINSDQQGRANWRFARLSHNRRFLHYADFEHRPPIGTADPTLDELTEKIDLQGVSSVISNVVPISASPASSTTTLQATLHHSPGSPVGSPKTPTANNPLALGSHSKPSQPTSRIVINAHAPSSSGGPVGGSSGNSNAGAASSHSHHSQHNNHHKTGSDASSASHQRQEVPVMTLYPANPSLASEWLDGLLMLLDQAPITDETKRLLSTIGAWGLKIRLLNVSFDDAVSGYSDEGGNGGTNNGNNQSAAPRLSLGRGDGTSGMPKVPGGRGVVPSREGLDEDYYYDVFGGV